MMRCFIRDLGLTGLFLAAILLGCSEERDSQRAAPSISYAPRESGSIAAPTHEYSFYLFAADGPKRLKALQSLVTGAGEKCDMATSGVLVAALDGTDEWRLTCLDGSRWGIWLRPDRDAEVVSCLAPGCQ